MTEPLHASARRTSSSVWIALLIILALASFLRFHTIASRHFFFDELWIAELSSGHGSDFLFMPVNQYLDQPNLVALDYARPWWQIPAHMTGAIHPPAAFIVLRFWRDLFGDSIVALRGCSATWSVVVVLLTFFAGRISFSNAAGLWAALLSAISLANIDQAQDVRGYTMLEALLLLTAIALLKMRGKTSCWPGAIAVGAGALLMMFTHYFAAGACAAIMLGAFFLLKGPTRWQTVWMIALSGVVFAALWFRQLKAQLAFVPETADIFLIDQTQFPLGSTMLRLFVSPYRALVADAESVNLRTLIGGCVVGYFLISALRKRDGAEGRSVPLFWVAVVACVVGQLATLDIARKTQHLEYMKYFLLANPPLCILIGSVVVWREWLMPALASVGLCVAMFITPLPPKPDLRPQLAYLKEHASPQDVVIIPSQFNRSHGGQTMYLFVANALPWPTHHILLAVGPATPQLMATLPRGVRWFCFSFGPEDRPEIWLPGTKIVDTGPSTLTAIWEVKPIDPPATQP